MVEQNKQPQQTDMFSKIGDMRISKLEGLTIEEKGKLKPLSIVSAGMLFGQIMAEPENTARYLGVSEKRILELAEISFSALSPVLQERLGSEPIEGRRQYPLGA